MKNLFLFTGLALFFTLLIPNFGKAELVSYIDDKGQMRYVNTDFAKIPEKYRDQIETQLNKPATGTTDTTGTESDPESEGEIPQPELVEILVESGCLDCQSLQIRLRAHQVVFYVYDINTTERGRELYAEIGGGELPITSIGSRTFYGLDIENIVYIYHNEILKNRKPPEDINGETDKLIPNDENSQITQDIETEIISDENAEILPDEEPVITPKAAPEENPEDIVKEQPSPQNNPEVKNKYPKEQPYTNNQPWQEPSTPQPEGEGNAL